MTIRPVRNETDYDEALAEIDSLMGVAPGTPESDRLEVLVTLVERYESEQWVIDAPDPISAIGHVMEARGLRQRDLGGADRLAIPCLGSASPSPSPFPRHDPHAREGMGSSSRCPGA